MRIVYVVAALLLVARPALADPANNIKQLGAQLSSCLSNVKLDSTSEWTVRFSLKRDGSLNGQPRITYAKLPKDETVRAEDAKSIADGFNHCLPAKITDGLGGAIAGQLFTFSFGPRKSHA